MMFGDKKKEKEDHGVLSYDDDEEENVSEYTDDELEEYGLNEWEKEEVKKGYQDPWNFDEEDLEDDDYYSDDD